MTQPTKPPPKPAPTLHDVFADLSMQGLLELKTLPQVEEYLTKTATKSSELWFVKALLAIGAWVAAICFVACLGIANLIDDKAWNLLPWAAAFLTSATILRRLTPHVFPAQLALALSAVGHAFALTGAAILNDGGGERAGCAVVSIVLCLVLYPLYADSLHRFLSCLLAAGCLTTWIVGEQVWPLIHVEMLAKIVAIGLVFMYRPDLRMLRPLGYAMAVSVPASLFLVLLPEEVIVAPWWPANVILAAGLIWLYHWVAGSWRAMQSEPLVLAIVATVGLASFTTPGLLAAVGLMVLGYARRDKHLMGIGIAFFPVFIVVFYYEWQISLLIKSWIMAGSGALLLAARWYLSSRSWAREVEA
ncbi:MAG: DUF4401 domain-containing protein [Planctomycetota bacterium]